MESVSDLSGTAREGLPPSYRMRAEGHYVDLLAARSSGPREKTLAIGDIIAREGDDEPAAALVTLTEMGRDAAKPHSLAALDRLFLSEFRVPNA